MSGGLRALPASVRFAAMTFSAFVLLLGLVGAVAFWQFGASLRGPVDRSLTHFAGEQAAVIGDGAEDLLRGLRADPTGRLAVDELEAQVLAADGTVLLASGGAAGGPALVQGRQLVRVATGEAVHGNAPVAGLTHRFVGTTVPDGSGRIVVVSTSIESLTSAETALLAVFVPVALVGSASAGLAGLLIARRGLRPLTRMAAQAEAIGAYDLSHRLPTPPRRDEIGQLGRTLNHMLERLDAVVRREREFVADASHELRTPLAIARAEIELVRDLLARPDGAQTLDRPAARAGLTSAIEEIDRLSAVVDDLILLARVDDGVALDRSQPVDLGDLAATAVRRFATVAAPREVDVVATGTATVTGDPSAIERVLANLVDNALRHTPHGGLIEITVEQRGTGGALVVRDTGTGVDPDLLSTLFDRFTRSEPSRGGAGLGLSIVAAVAASHGGSVTARNLSTGGLEITFSVG